MFKNYSIIPLLNIIANNRFGFQNHQANRTVDTIAISFDNLGVFLGMYQATDYVSHLDLLCKSKVSFFPIIKLIFKSSFFINCVSYLLISNISHPCRRPARERPAPSSLRADLHYIQTPSPTLSTNNHIYLLSSIPTQDQQTLAPEVGELRLINNTNPNTMFKFNSLHIKSSLPWTTSRKNV